MNTMLARRAMSLKVDYTHGAVFTVSGGANPHRVEQNPNSGRFTCDCPAASFGRSPCSHVLAARWFLAHTITHNEQRDKTDESVT